MNGRDDDTASMLFKTKAIGAKMIGRLLHRRDDSETGCQAISLVSYLEAANEKLRQAVAELMDETAALRQELEKMECRERAAETKTRRQGSSNDPQH